MFCLFFNANFFFISPVTDLFEVLSLLLPKGILCSWVMIHLCFLSCTEKDLTHGTLSAVYEKDHVSILCH